MDSNPTPMHELTAGGLHGLSRANLADFDTEGVVVLLTVVGDAMRLGMTVPPALNRGIEQAVAEDTIRAAIGSLAVSVSGWSLPRRARADRQDPSLEWALRRRDEIESARTAARRFLMPRGIILDTTDEAAALSAALRNHDLSCGGTLARSDAEQMLGHRIAAIAEHSWLDEIEKWAPEALVEEPQRRELDGLGAPSLETLEQYVVHGRLARWVESAAARSAEVADELREMIDTYRENEGRVGIVARRWAKSASFEVPAQLARAASSGADVPAEKTGEHALGSLGEVDAEGLLTISPSKIVLAVFPGDVELAKVTLGSSTGARVEGSHRWEAELRFDASKPSQNVTMRVVDVNGRSFETELTIKAPR